MSDCPLKLASLDAPHLTAIASKSGSLTFAELDRYVDALQISIQEGECLQIPITATISDIALFFALWREQASIFPFNPRIPQIAEVKYAPPQSLLLLTSGSTGAPKTAILSLDNLIANASGAIPALDLRPNDRWRLSLPLYHVGGIGIILRCILARATIVLDDDPSITHLSYVPTHLYRATPIYPKLRCLLLGGAPIHQVPKQLPIFTTYGLTEMGSMVTLNGEVLPNRELQLASDGEILVKGPCLFQQYLGQAPHTDWFATKDLGKFENGKLLITGRKDWMFISGGENIQPEEIEKELLTLPNVLEAVVIAKDDPEFGKRPIAVIKAQNMFTLEQMQHALMDRLPKYKIPIDLYFADEIPKKDNFKINRFIISQYINNQLLKNTSGQKKLPYL